ncbi:MAG: hypothetical protein IPN94_21840 [Sphingobacteriales bacterium]|nr:hypothetical protein [Sphingobacteriales bacterium]
MKKTVQTTAWQFSKQLLAIACFLVIGMVQVAAQTTTNYVVSISVRNMSWDYPGADPFDNGDFGFVVGGNFYSLPEDGMPDAGNYVTNYNTGTPLNEIVWAGVVPIGTNLAGVPDAQVIFQAYENDCGDLMQFDTGFLDCGVNPDDSNVDVILGIDWLSVVPTDANGQPVPGTYNIGFGGAAGGPFNGGDGSSYDVAFTVTVLAVDPPLNACDLDVFPTGNGVSYACLSDAAANTSVFISGGTAPYKILGSGIYNAVTGDPFDFGVDPFGLTVGAGTFEFQVREGQPWTVIVQDAVGCIVAQEGVFDLPNPLFNTPATMCTSDPVINIFENSIFDPAGDILDGQFFFSVAGGVDNGDGFSATFDPFIAGPGQHFIAYCVQAQGGGGPGFGPGNYEDGCQICYEQTIYVYPSFDGYDGAGNLVTEIGLNTGGSPEADAALQTNVCVGHANMSLGLTNFDDFDALFASLELAFDPNGQIDETDFFITWAGNGVTDNADGTATFSPAALGPVPPGGIATSIQVTVGYPSCPTVYVVVMNVMPNFNATVNDVATCATAGNMFDLTGAFGANTTAGGYFYTVGAGGALTAVTSGTLSEAANAGTSVTILYSNTAGLTNQSQCNADDCINCDTAVITFSGLTVDCAFALDGGPEVCRGTTPLVDTVVDPIITNSPVTGIQATAVGNNVIPKDLTTTASLGTIDPYGFINSIEVEINYTGLNGNTQGDHNGYSVTMPGGVTFVAADVPVGQTSNYTVTYTNGTAAWNTDIPTPNNDTFNDHTITWEQIQAAYANANLNINDVFTGTNAPGLVGTCQENEFTFDLETNANNAAISITVTPSYVEPAGFVTAFIWSTGTQLPAEAITFDNVTGEYYLNTLFTDANGSAWDLSTYLDIELVHTTYSCSAQLPDGTLCTQSCTEVIKVLPALITDIANLTACINDGAIDLEQMFIQGTATGTDGINITGGTTQGGVFTATNGTLNGNYFTPTAGATSSTITYTIGAGTGADGCDPLPSTATLTLETAADPEFNYPTTVCVGSIPALPAPADGTTSGLQVFDPQGNNISHAAFQAATVGGLYTIIQTTGPAGCQEEYTHDVLVVESPTAVSDDAYTVCRSQAVVDLTQFVAGSTMGGNFTGTGVAGEVLILGTLPSSTITYTVGSNGCTATTTFTITIVDQPNAAFDVIDQICEGTTVNLYDYTLQDNGTFTDNGVAVSNPAAWTATGSGLHNLVYTITIGTSCTDTDQENVYVIGDQTVTAEYGFLCQSTTDFTIDLTNQLPDGSGTQNGGDFGLERVPPFISEIEYNNVTGNNGSGPWGNGTDW